MNIILASNSPRRKEILAQVGIPFTVQPSEKEEVITKTVPSEVVMELATMKAEDVASKVEEEAIIVGADTVVSVDGKILGKPKNEEDAKRMVESLAGKSHSVFTGVTIVRKEKSKGRESGETKDGFEVKTVSFFEETKVWVYPMSKEEIHAYVATKEPMDKAGAYGIQGDFAKYIQGIEGDYYNVVGFPIGRFYQELKQML